MDVGLTPRKNTFPFAIFDDLKITGEPWDSLLDAIEKATDIHFNLDGIKLEKFKQFQKDGLHNYPGTPGRMTNRELYEVLKNHTNKATFYETIDDVRQTTNAPTDWIIE